MNSFSTTVVSLFLTTSLLFADAPTEPPTEPDSSSIKKLELEGGDSFGYDIGNKIKKSKSNFNIGIGANLTKMKVPSFDTLNVNVSVIFGYSYFFHKTFGLRGYGLFDYSQRSFYGGGGIDAFIDFLQFEQFGMGIIAGSSLGYEKMFSPLDGGAMLGQFHIGFSMNFDVGKSRLEGLVRIPYHKINVLNTEVDVGFSYIIMYSYTF